MSLGAALLQSDVQAGVVMNVNVPNRPRSELAGVKASRLGYTDWADAVTERADPRGGRYYWIGGDRGGHDAIEGSDNNALADGFVSVTPMHYDLTDYRSLALTRGLAPAGYTFTEDGLGDEILPHPAHPRAART